MVTDDEIANLIPNSKNFSEVADVLGVSRRRVRTIANNRELSCLGGKRYTHVKYSEENILSIAKEKRKNLAKWVRDNNIFPYLCRECENSGVWNGIPLTLQLDHINGNALDNRKENLRWLCPNCHSQTNTYCGKKRL